MARFSNFKSTLVAAADTAAGASSAATTVVADINALIALTGMSDGDQAFVTANNNLYFYSSGWYKIATVSNDSPSSITGVNGSYALEIDGTATTITAVSTDPEGFPLTWSYSTSGLGSIATISQSSNVFTITPSTNSANQGTFTLTINATDGVNGAVSTSSTIQLTFQIVNSKYTTALITAVDTSDNNSITDASSNNYSITANGNSTAGTFSPYRHGGYSAEFDGSGDWLSVPSDASLEMGSGDWTIEAWVYTESSSQQAIAYIGGNASYYGLRFEINGGGSRRLQVLLSANGSSLDMNYTATTGGISLNTWTHVACVRNGSDILLFENGNQVGTTQSFSGSLYSGSLNQIGTISGVNYFNGYMSDVRVTKGSAIYTSNFTPPTARLTAVSGTGLLTCKSNRFIDNSTNNHVITVNGNTKISMNVPYDYKEYSASNHGGSVYFDGTGGTNLTLTNIPLPPTADFTAEAWIYALDVSQTNHSVLVQYSPGNSQRALLYIYNQAVRVFVGGSDIVGPSISTHRWYHLAWVRNSGTDTLYVNGVSEGTASLGTIQQIGMWIGDVDVSSSEFHGYISDIKITNSAVYNSSFTPPTSPLSSSGATLHIKGTDASIIDKAQGTNLELVGNTTGSTTQVKFASTKSAYFDGTGDILKGNLNFSLGTSNITVEGWYYQSSSGASDQGLFCTGTGWNSANSISLITYNGGYAWSIGAVGTYQLVSSPSAPTNQWVHFAITRAGSACNLWINGSNAGSLTNSNDLNLLNYQIGYDISSAFAYLNGYIQDYRITKGLARYTANFTPPTSELQG